MSLIILCIFFFGCEIRDVDSLSKDYFKAWVKGDFETIENFSSQGKKDYYKTWIDVCTRAKEVNKLENWLDDLTEAGLKEKYNDIDSYTAKLAKAETVLDTINVQRLKANEEIKNKTKYPYISLDEQGRTYNKFLLELDKKKFKNIHLYISIKGNEKEYFDENIKNLTKDMARKECLNSLFSKQEVSNVIFHLKESLEKDKYRVLIDFESKKRSKQLEIIYLMENNQWKVDQLSLN